MSEKQLPSQKLDPLQAHRRITTRQVMELAGIKSRNTLWKRVNEGKLPKPVYLEPHQPQWVFGEVLDALQQNTKPFDSQVRGFKGDPDVQTANDFTPTKDSNAASKVLERLGLRKKG
jgi:predicted DNA-binding transcriptional regulator AlpA